MPVAEHRSLATVTACVLTGILAAA